MRNHKYYRNLWEETNGKKIPNGFHIHHLNGDKTDNSPDNLVCLSPMEHFNTHKLRFEQTGDKRDYFAMTYLQRYLDDKQDFSQYKRPPISEKHRQAIIKAHKGRTHPNYLISHSEDTKKKMSETRKAQGVWNSTKCKDIETGIEYKSLTEMANAIGLVRKTKGFEARCMR